MKHSLPPSLFPVCDLRAERGLITAINQNVKITDALEKLIEITRKMRTSTLDKKEKTKHGYRLNSFTNALEIIRSQPKPITSGAEASLLKGIGKGLAARIDEILKTGTLSEIQEAERLTDPQTLAIMNLTQITGIGEERALKLFTEFGVTTVDELIEAYRAGRIKVGRNQLTNHIAVGLQYHHDIQQRIPWQEVDEIREAIELIVEMRFPEVIATVCGSYRRKKSSCGDIDVLISPADKSAVLPDSTLPKLINLLTEEELIVGHLTERGTTKFMGICKLRPELPGRRIDIRLVTAEAYPAALLYFTGSGMFNKIMRYKANERGYTINEYGIFYQTGGVKGPSIPVETEEDIFKVINCRYLDPTEREFG